MIRRGWALALAFVALPGCASLQAVSRFSETLISAGQTWDGVGRELTASCQRHTQFNAAIKCDSSANAVKVVTAADAVLLNYFNAMHDTANEANFTVQPGLDDLAGSVQAIPGIDADKAQAVAGLAGLLARFATEGLRQDTLRRLIGDGAPPARKVIALLKQTLPPALRVTLKAERDSLDATYALFIQTAGKTLPQSCEPPPRAFDHNERTFLLAEDYCRRRLALDAKDRALTNYEASLDTADKALGDLESGKARLSGKELAKILFETGKDLHDKVTAVKKAFGQDDNG